MNVYKAIKYDDYAKLTFTGSVADKGSATHTFDVSGATFVTATLYWDTGSSDIDLYLYDPPNGTRLTTPTPPTTASRRSATTTRPPEPGRSRSSATRARRTTRSTSSATGASASPAAATRIQTPPTRTQPPPTTDTQTFTGSVNDYWDTSDTFTMNVNSGATKITGDLTFDTSYNDLDLYLYDPPNGNLVDRSTSSNSYEHVEYANPAPGTWTFLVYAYSTYGWADYQLKAVVYYG